MIKTLKQELSSFRDYLYQIYSKIKAKQIKPIMNENIFDKMKNAKQ